MPSKGAQCFIPAPAHLTLTTFHNSALWIMEGKKNKITSIFFWATEYKMGVVVQGAYALRQEKRANGVGDLLPPWVIGAPHLQGPL